jgi:hypothetical protein
MRNRIITEVLHWPRGMNCWQALARDVVRHRQHDTFVNTEKEARESLPRLVASLEAERNA